MINHHSCRNRGINDTRKDGIYSARYSRLLKVFGAIIEVDLKAYYIVSACGTI